MLLLSFAFKTNLKKSFFCLLFFEGTFISFIFFEDKASQKEVIKQ
jgi:hypothetical protein